MENNFHEVNYLFGLHNQLSSYPKGVILSASEESHVLIYEILRWRSE